MDDDELIYGITDAGDPKGAPLINGIIGTNDALDAKTGVLKGWKKIPQNSPTLRGRPREGRALRYASAHTS